jgi:MFS family permease
MAPKAKTEGSPLFYGWYILAASFVILFFNAGARSSISVMFKPIAAEFGWNRSTVSFAFFLQMVLFAISLSLMGRFYDRYGPKWVIIISTLFISIGYMFISLTDNLWQFLLFYSVIAAVGLGGTSVAIFAAISSKWFEKGRAFAASLSLSGNCMGQFVLVPAMTFFVINYGWRISHFLIGVVMLVVNITLALFVIKGDPEDLGHKPYGLHEGNIPGEQRGFQASDVHQKDIPLTEAMKTRSFWCIFTFMFFCGTADFLVTTHLIPFVTDYGISPTSAGNMLALFGLLSMAGILVAGPIADRIGNKIPLSMVYFLRVMLLLLIVKYQNPVSFYVFALLFGFTFLISAPLLPALIGKLFGFTHVGLISGFLTTFHYLGGGLGAYVGGLIFDNTGSYQNAFLLLAMMSLISAFSCTLIQEKRYDLNPKRSHQVATESRTP